MNNKKQTNMNQWELECTERHHSTQVTRYDAYKNNDDSFSVKGKITTTLYLPRYLCRYPDDLYSNKIFATMITSKKVIKSHDATGNSTELMNGWWYTLSKAFVCSIKFTLRDSLIQSGYNIDYLNKRCLKLSFHILKQNW